jgi:hypothetical protein
MYSPLASSVAQLAVHNSHLRRALSVNLNSCYNQFPESLLILGVVTHLASGVRENFGVRKEKMQGPLLFLAKRFDCKSSPNMIPRYSTSNEARKCRGPFSNVCLLHSMHSSHLKHYFYTGPASAHVHLLLFCLQPHWR